MTDLQTAMRRARLARFHVEPRYTIPQPVPSKPVIIAKPAPRIIPSPPPKPIPPVLTTHAIIGIVARRYKITRDELKGRSRFRKYSEPRHVAMYLTRVCVLSSYPDIGRKFGRDHATCITACRKISAKVESDPEFYNMVEEMRQEIMA